MQVRSKAHTLAHGCAFVFAIALMVCHARADRVDDLVNLHKEALGGKERIARLSAMRATGHVLSAGNRVRFTMYAARPDKIRLETDAGVRTLVQGTDGRDAPWEFDTGSWPPRYRDMAPAAAKLFAADAEFDDPLVGGAARGYRIEWSGEAEDGGRKLPRLLVTRSHTETFSILLDPDTLLIAKRVEEKKDKLGIPAKVETTFGDYRPVAGVLVPHEITVSSAGRVLQQTRINAIEPNPKLEADMFSRPAASRGR